MRAVFRYLLVAALALSTCAMRAASAHAQELTPDRGRPVLALIGAPGSGASVVAGAAPDAAVRTALMATGRSERSLNPFERASERFRRP